ncbi:hypothetical protein HK097_010639 [Rhizophlyctis rosea]|uniref:Uncharacterized protein n=1 Tax=Rhizophlyctis rosea TaxID=64517 RepID=A0AAD5SA29_9FUNG|nr:hypothetical protein HK097_010639 [Rhizophlyctis rosea]
MSNLEQLAEEFIDLENLDEYKAADKMVKDHAKKLDVLKKRMHCDGVKKVEVRRGSLLKKVKFEVSVCRRVDVSLLPDDMKDAHMKEGKVWKKSTDVIDLNEYDGTHADVIE